MRAALLVLLLASCRQIFGLHELAGKHDDARGSTSDALDSDAVGDGSIVDGLPDAPPGTYRVIGTLYGLYGGSLVIANVGSGANDSQGLSADGPFTFLVAVNAAYDITVTALPPGASCKVFNETGTSSGPDVTNVIAACRTQDILCDTAGVCDKLNSMEYCCQTPAMTYSCNVTGGGSPCPGPVINCDDTADCGSSNICCGYVSAGAVSSTGCSPPAACLSNGTNVILCDPTSATPCPSGNCVPSTLTGAPRGFFQCQ